jgi:Neuraminidase (sialidase)
LDPANVIWLFFKIGPSPQSWTGAYLQSTDSGKTWSDVVWMPSGLIGPVRNKPIILSNGHILSGTSSESYRAWASWMELSEDGGKTWKKYGPLLFPTMEENRPGSIQPTLLEIEPGVVRALVRTRAGKIGSALSRDGGRSWSALSLIPLDQPGSGIDSVRLMDGRCVLIYNPSKRRRNPITAAVSTDGGETWKDFLEIERLGDSERGELSYPNVIQSGGGAIHVVYTWKRQRIRHAAIPLESVPTNVIR